MATRVSEIFSHLHTLTSVFFTLMFLELVVLIRSVTGGVCTSTNRRQVSTTQFLEIVELKYPTLLYRSGSRADPVDCAVCLSEIKEGERVRKLQCNHMFHRDCLDRWLQQCGTTCPLCRDKVLPENAIAGGDREVQNDVEYDGSDEEMMFLLSALHGNSLHSFF